MCKDREDESSATLIALPSFGQPPKLHASPYTVSPQHSSPAEADEDFFSDDFEFSLLIRDSETHSPITADEIFSDGHIRPIYPVRANASAAFKEKPTRPQLLQLLMEEQDWSTSEISSSYADELEGLPPGAYCLWPQEHSQGSVHKCCSTGSFFRLWIRYLVHRLNNSEEKKISFIAAEEKGSTENEDKEGGAGLWLWVSGLGAAGGFLACFLSVYGYDAGVSLPPIVDGLPHLYRYYMTLRKCCSSLMLGIGRQPNGCCF